MSLNGSHHREALPPILVNQNCSAQNVLTCTLCCEIPADPVVTPCHHVFCRGCLGQALQMRSECPNDRTPLRASDLRNIDGPLKRIWAQIPVQCPKCNVWKGTFESYWTHATNCTSSQEELRQMEEKLRISEMLLNEKISECQILEERLQRTEMHLDESRKNVEDASRRRCNCKPFDPNYQYHRDNVVELAQLICRNLNSKPANVDSNQIYNRIKRCFDDLERGWNDNPQYFDLDMRMLLSVCHASSWFSPKQQENILRWLSSRW